jgi:hypothetical protein
MFRKILLLICCLITFPVWAQTIVTNTEQSVTIGNKYVSLNFNLTKGIYSVKNIPRNFMAISDAYFQAEGLFSTDTTIKISDKAKGLTILSISTKNNEELEWSVAFKQETGVHWPGK